MYIIHSTIVILIWTLVITVFSSCATIDSTHAHCDYAWRPDSSGAHRWVIECTEIPRPVDDCVCQYEEITDHEGELLEVENESKN
jgi:hypothetical protein